MCGGRVTLSDREGNPRLQDNLRLACDMNNIPIGSGADRGRGVVLEILALSWGIFSPALLELGPQDIVLASDCFYDSKGDGLSDDFFVFW